jgi:hypothetical protein
MRCPTSLFYPFAYTFDVLVRRSQPFSLSLLSLSQSSCTGQGFFRVVVEAGIETVQSLSGSADMIVVGGALMEWCRRRFAPSEMSLEVLLISRMVES